MKDTKSRRGIIHPTSPEGKYWFNRHLLLIEVFKGLADSGAEEFVMLAYEVLNNEAALDLHQVNELKRGIITNEDNLVIVDKFKGGPGVAPEPKKNR